MFIGCDCMLASGVTVRTGDSHSIYYHDQRYNFPEDVFIGNHIWIGEFSLILKRCQLGHGCIFTARSVVTRALPQNNILVAGVPASIKKTSVHSKHAR